MTEYEEELREVAAEQEADIRWPPVTVKIDGPQGAGKTRLGKLLSAVLAEATMVDQEGRGDGSVSVMGYVDGPIENFLDQLAKKDAEIDRLGASINDSEDERHKAVLQAAENEAVADALEKRLAEVEGRKLALAVAHGDIAPEAYDRRRQIAVEGVRSYVAAARLGFRRQLGGEERRRR